LYTPHTHTHIHAIYRIAALFTLATLLHACGTDDVQKMSGSEDDEPDMGRTSPDIAPPIDMSANPVDQGPDQEDQAADMASTPDQGPEDMPPAQDMPVEQDMAQPPQDMLPAQDMPVTPDMPIAPDMPPATPTCAQQLRANVTFDLDSAGLNGQYYSRPVFDGSGVWIAYSRPHGAASSEEGVYITRLGCDGNTLYAPTLVSRTNGYRGLSPAVAADSTHLYVVYNEEQVDPNAQRIMLRVLTLDGTPITQAPVEVTPTDVAGAPISNLVWQPDVATIPNGQGALIVAAAVLGAADPDFQIVGQRVNAMNQRVGDGFVIFEEKGVEQQFPSVSVNLDGAATIAWTRGNPFAVTSSTPRVVFTTVPAGSSAANPPAPARPGSSSDNQLGTLSKEKLPGGKVFLAYQMDQNTGVIGIRDATPGAPLRQDTVGQTNTFDLRPTISLGPTTGVIGWLRGNPTPTQNTLLLHPFTHTNGIVKGQQRTIQTATPVRAPFGPGITHITGTTFFISWSEGMTPQTARVKGRFVTF
jgi:hypothetical protein